MLKKLAYPHRNLEVPDMKLQAKIDRLNWSCFVPKCESKRLMTKKLIFFPVPAGNNLSFHGHLNLTVFLKVKRECYGNQL